MKSACCALVLVMFCVISIHGLTINDIGFTAERCAAIRGDVQGFGSIPCPCRLNTGKVEAVQCYPNCCPKTLAFEGDRCHIENKLSWSVYEQQVCREQPPAEYLADNPNCFYRGNPPLINSATVTTTTTTLSFELSILDLHRCDNLFISKCNSLRDPFPAGNFRLNTTDAVPKHCWLKCPPTPLAPCTAESCVYHRGETRSVIRSWTLPVKLVPGDYALSCYTLVKGEAVGSSLYQNAYASTSFKIHSHQ
jgi:ferredoxin-thioredoxin reductase catalytic subunit